MKHELKTTGLRAALIGTCQRCGRRGVNNADECVDACVVLSMDDRVARLLRQFRVGERVRAVEALVYGTGEEVPEGTRGTVQQTNVHGCTPLVRVAWDDLPAVTQACSVESLDPEVVS